MPEDKSFGLYKTIRETDGLKQSFEKVSYDQFKKILYSDAEARELLLGDLKEYEIVPEDGTIEDFDDYLGITPPTKKAPVQPVGVLRPKLPEGQVYSEELMMPPEILGGVKIEPAPDDAVEFTPNFNQFESQAKIEQSAQSPVFQDYPQAQSALKDGRIFRTKEEEAAFEQLTDQQKKQAGVEPKKKERGIIEGIKDYSDAFAAGFDKAFLKAPTAAVKTVAEIGVWLLNKVGVKAKVKDDIVYNIADKYDKWIDDVFEPAEDLKGGTIEGIGQGFGQIATMAFGGALGNAKSVLQAAKSTPAFAKVLKDSYLTRPAAIAFSQVFNSEYENAINSGESDDTAFNIATQNAVMTAPSEAIPLASLAKRLEKVFGSRLARTAINGTTQLLEEGTQEGYQQVFSNITNNQYVELEKNLKEWSDGVQESSEVGGIVGAILGTALGALTPGKQRGTTEPQPTQQEEVSGDGTTKIITVNSLEEVPAEYRSQATEVTTGPPILGRFGIGEKKQYVYNVPIETIDVETTTLPPDETISSPTDRSGVAQQDTPESGEQIQAATQAMPQVEQVAQGDVGTAGVGAEGVAEGGVEGDVVPSVEFKTPELKISTPEGFAPALRKLGYTDEEISGMTIDQQQEIAINKTEPARAESAAKVDSVKENQKQEKIAEAQAKLDEAEEKLLGKPKEATPQAGVVGANPALKDVESTAKALEGKKASLDKKAKKLGYIGIKQFNAQNQLNENLSDEEKALLQEYSDFQQEVKNLKDENVIAKLSGDEFSSWSKANDITRDDLGKVVKDEEIELAAKRIRILNARGDSKKADSELKKLKESKKKDNWTVESWKERFDEDIEQSEIDDINQSNKEFNNSLDKAVEQLLGKPKEATPQAGVVGGEVSLNKEIETLKQSIAENAAKLKLQLGDLFKPDSRLGAVKMSEQAAKELYEKHKAIVETLKNLVSDISQIAKISADEFADLVGQKASNLFRSAYDAFKSGKTTYEDFVKYNEIEVEESETTETKKSRAAERAVEGDNSEDFKNRMEELGYSYEVANRKKSGELAKKLIEDYGWKAVLDGIRSGQITGAPATRAFGDIIDILGAKLNEAQTPEEFQEALDEQSKLIKEFSLRLTDLGQGIQAAIDVYLETDFKFNLASMINDYKAAGGVMDAETMKKFKELEQEIKDLTAKLAENEKAQKEAEEAQILNAYTESQDRADNRPKGIKEAAKATANRIRKLKLARPDYINASSPAALAWDAAVETVAVSIEAGGTIAYAIEKGLKKLRESEWYKKSNKDIQEKVEVDFATGLTDKSTVEPEFIDGKVKITKGAIAALVRQGYDTIDKVVDKVHEMLGEPSLTKRQIRDAITKYGKTINLSKDETLKKVREITRIGRLISQLEDVRKKIRPLKTGLQRDKLTEEERRLQRQLNDALKELPPTEADLSKAIKTALDGIKSRLTNQIEDLNAQIERRERVIRTQKKTTYDAEATALKEQRDALKAALDDLVGKQEISDEQKIKNALDAVEKSIAEYQRRIVEKDFSSFKKEPIPESEELTKARAERDRLKEEYEVLKSGTPKTEEQKKLERLQAQLDNILQGKVAEPKDRTEDSAEVKDLKEQIQKAKEQMGLVAGKRTQAEIAYESAVKAAKKRLDDIEARIANKVLSEAAKKATQFGPELDALKKAQKDARETLDALRNQAGIIEAEKLAQYKKAAQEAINEYNRRIREGDYSTKERSPLLKLDAEAQRLRTAKIRAKEDYLKALENARRKNTPYKWFSLQPVQDIMGAMRVFLATGEFSFIGIQGKMITAGTLLRNPKQAKQFFRDMFQALASPEKGRQLVHSIKALEIYPEMKSSGLLIQDEFTPEALQNELVHTPLAEKMWNILEYPVTLITFGDLPRKGQEEFLREIYQKSNPLEALERASNTFSNALRVSEYLRGREMLLQKGITFDDNPVAYKELAQSINTMTSRTNLGKWGEAGVQNLNLILFSTRNWASTFKNLPPVSLFYYGRKNTDAATKKVTIPDRTFKVGDKTVKIPGRTFEVQKELSVPQKIYIQNFMSSVALTSAIVASAVAIANFVKPEDDDEEKPILELDPRSSAAGKVRFGKQYLDPWAGYSQHIVLYSRIIADILIDLGFNLDGSYKPIGTGQLKRLGETTFVPTKGELAFNMLRNKMSPGMGIGWDYFNSAIDEKTGARELNGREIDLLENYRQTFVPMYFSSVQEIAEQQPMLAREFLISLGMIGMGVNTIEPPVPAKFNAFAKDYPKEAEKLKETYKEKGIPNSFITNFVEVSDENYYIVDPKFAKEYYKEYKSAEDFVKKIYASEDWLKKAKEFNEKAKQEADYFNEKSKKEATKRGVRKYEIKSPDYIEIYFQGEPKDLPKLKQDAASSYAKEKADEWLYKQSENPEKEFEVKKTEPQELGEKE